MTDREQPMRFTEDQLVALLVEHYEPVSPPAGFEQSLLAEAESEFRRLHSRGRRPSRWNIFRRIPMPRLAIPAAIVTVVVVLALLALFPSRDVLAQAAELMKRVRTFHYTVTVPGMPDQPVREMWSHDNKTYCRVCVKGRIVAEAWIDAGRMVAYDAEENRVVFKPYNPGLKEGLYGVQLVSHLQPGDWKVLPQRKISEGGKSWLVCEAGTGQFSGMGTSGDTKTQLWIDQKTALPGKVTSQMRSAPSAEWKPFMVLTFLWPESEVPDSFFEPKYPADAKVTDERSLPSSRNPNVEQGPGPSTENTAPPPAQNAPSATPAGSGETILTVSKDGGKTGITLERAWIHPAGLVILRVAWQGRQGFGEPPHFADPSKNPWNLKPDEIPPVVEGQLVLEPPAQTEYLTAGGIENRWAGYEIFRFRASPDGKPPVKLTYRRLLARTKRPEDGGFSGWVAAVLRDPSSWELYEFSIPTQPYLTDRIPEEIYASPNLRVSGPFLAALRGIVHDYEARSPEKALQFLKSQGAHTQEMFRDEILRLTVK